MITILNLFSLMAGLVALALPIVFINRIKNISEKSLSLIIFASMSLCAIAIFIHLIQFFYLSLNQQWGDIADSVGFVLMMSSYVLAISIVLNSLVVYKYHKLKGNKIPEGKC